MQRPGPQTHWRFGWWAGPLPDQELFTQQDREWLQRMWALTDRPAGFVETTDTLTEELAWVTFDRIR